MRLKHALLLSISLVVPFPLSANAQDAPPPATPDAAAKDEKREAAALKLLETARKHVDSNPEAANNKLSALASRFADTAVWQENEAEIIELQAKARTGVWPGRDDYRGDALLPQPGVLRLRYAFDKTTELADFTGGKKPTVEDGALTATNTREPLRAKASFAAGGALIVRVEGQNNQGLTIALPLGDGLFGWTLGGRNQTIPGTDLRHLTSLAPNQWTTLTVKVTASEFEASMGGKLTINCPIEKLAPAIGADPAGKLEGIGFFIADGNKGRLYEIRNPRIRIERMNEPVLDLGGGVTLPIDALTLRASQSGGPGGQHVNKTSSQIEVRLDIPNCEGLSEPVRMRLIRVLAPRLTKAGELIVSCSTHRSQHLNRRDGILRVESILREALRPKKKRRPTKPTRASRKRRLDAKGRKSRIKALRRKPGRDD